MAVGARARGLLRRGGAHGLALAGGIALELSRRLAGGHHNLQGDRWVEWSFCLERLVDGPAKTLDFGAGTGFLSLAAAQRGHDVVAVDQLPPVPDFKHDRVLFQQADILDRPLSQRAFDQIVNCSTVEHVGLSGRYGSREAPDGDLEAMLILREAMKPGGRMVLTIPVGRDFVCAPLHRIYGSERLPKLLEGYEVHEEQYWSKGDGKWAQTSRDDALNTEGSAVSYSLGLFVLSDS